MAIDQDFETTPRSRVRLCQDLEVLKQDIASDLWCINSEFGCSAAETAETKAEIAKRHTLLDQAIEALQQCR